MKRIEVLDVWRSLAILLMVTYHILYDLFAFDVLGQEAVFSPWPMAIRFGAVGSFMLISGMVVRFSRSSIRRGAIVFCCGLIVSLVMHFVGEPVQFGVLHNLGFMMMAYGFLSQKIKIPRGIWFPLLCIAVFALTYYISENVRVETNLLVPLGLYSASFYSADYYPIFPWSMVFALGVWLGGYLPLWRERVPLLQQQFHPALSIAGRNSLSIYLVHQPVLYGLCWLIWGLDKGLPW